MSSGGMEWAYRMLARGDLDPMGALIVMHLGWRDAPNMRTNRGMARALGQHEKSIRLAANKLASLGIIARRSDQWVACETIAIVEQSAGAPKPDADHADGEGCGTEFRTNLKTGSGSEFRRGAEVSSAQERKSVPHKRKEKIENRARDTRTAQTPSSPSPASRASSGVSFDEKNGVVMGVKIGQTWHMRPRELADARVFDRWAEGQRARAGLSAARATA